MAQRDERSWQFRVSFALVALVAVLIFGFFYQSGVEVRSARPVEVAVERLKQRSSDVPGARQTSVEEAVAEPE